MAKYCEICHKGISAGNNVSHSHRKSKRKWAPNVQRVRVVDENGTPSRLSLIHILHPLTNILSLALLDRGLFSVSSAVGKTGFLGIAFPFAFFPHTHCGKSLGHSHGSSAFLNTFLTILSSKEWKEITAKTPSSLNASI